MEEGCITKPESTELIRNNKYGRRMSKFNQAYPFGEDPGVAKK